MFNRIINVNGRNNVILSQIVDSTVHLSLVNEGTPVSVIILTTIKDSFINNNNFNENALSDKYKVDQGYINEYYGDKLESWRPYQNEGTISSLLLEYQNKSGIKLQVYTANCKEVNNYEDFSKIINISPNVVFILDALSLLFTENQLFAKTIFTTASIGACFVPIDKNNSIISKIKHDLINEHMSLYSNFVNNYSEIYLEQHFDEGYLQIQLDLLDKNELFRFLTAIILLRLDRGGNWADARRAQMANQLILLPSLQKMALNSNL